MPTAKSPEHVVLGLALRQLRMEQGVSQEELGYRSGLHRNYVGACERGEINLSFGVLLRLVNALEVSFSELAHRYDGGRTAVDR